MFDDITPEEVDAWRPTIKGRRRHHLVPRFHLKRFADAEGSLTIRRRDNGKTFDSSVSNACVRAGYYDVPIDGRWVGDVEKGLSGLEDLAAPAIFRLLHDDRIGDRDRYRISVYMGMQLVRGKDFADSALATANARERLSRDTSTPQHARKVAKSVGLGDVNLQPVEPRRGGVGVPQPEFFRVAFLKFAADRFGEVLFNRAWHVVRFAEPCLLTADRPIVLWGRPTPTQPVGIKNAEVILYPIAMNASLAMYRQGAKPFFRGSAAHALAINAIVAASAYEWIFHHPEMNPLGDVDLPPVDPLVTVGEPTYERRGSQIVERWAVAQNMPTPPAGWVPPGFKPG